MRGNPYPLEMMGKQCKIALKGHLEVWFAINEIFTRPDKRNLLVIVSCSAMFTTDASKYPCR